MGLPASSFHDQSCKDSITALSENYHRKDMGGCGISFTRKNSLVSSDPHRSKRAGRFAKELRKSQTYFTTGCIIG